MPEQPEQTTASRRPTASATPTSSPTATASAASKPAASRPAADAKPSQTPWVPEPDFDAALIEEAAKKSGLVWLSPAGLSAKGDAARASGPQAVWHVWHDDAVTVVAGGTEQPLPLYAVPGRVVEVAMRSKDQGGRLISFLSQVELVVPGTPEWGAAAEALHAERLNLAEGDRYQQRWAAESAILRMRPLGGAVAPDGGSGAARPLPTPATTLGRMPKMIGGVPREKAGKPSKASKKRR
ncbi:hypothetical protein [Catenulispora rubra]|uniref:hypothetical protein n=1 Tax=Catenulispora rubra TaxID=280293 RepID=UPI0018924F43|nr:hypothetical protein [Catenulispora rubra]